jgi:hypothetical protein
MKPVATIPDMEEARSKERAFIFLWVNWAIHARHSEIEVRRLLDTWVKDFPALPADAYRADVSAQEGHLWDALYDWLRAEPQAQGNLMWGGAGALLWVRSGVIAASTVNAANLGYEELLAGTRRVFELE